MLNVYFTVDVEVWCDGWIDIDKKFSDSFRKYIYGPTSKGNYGLPYQLDILKHYGFTGVFFIEPLFSLRFSAQPLAEIVELVQESNQEIQLHLHTEWVDELKEPLLKDSYYKRQHLRYFSLEEQKILIATGIRLLKQAGVESIDAFRAGNFGFNRDTLRALAANGITFDSSYNAAMLDKSTDIEPGVVIVEPVECENVFEYPMTVFKDGFGSIRHVQLTACSYREIEKLLWQALENGRTSFVILSHSFELLNQAQNRSDDVIVTRFKKLFAFLDRNRDSFCLRGFQGLQPESVMQQPVVPLTSSLGTTGMRAFEQVYRKVYK